MHEHQGDTAERVTIMLFGRQTFMEWKTGAATKDAARLLRRGSLLLDGWIHRRHCIFQEAPWSMSAIVDPRLSHAEKLSVARAHSSSQLPECKAEVWWLRPLRAELGNLDELLSDRFWQGFLTCYFRDIGMGIAPVEARHNRNNKQGDDFMTFAGLNSLYLNTEFRTIAACSRKHNSLVASLAITDDAAASVVIQYNCCRPRLPLRFRLR